MFQRHLIGSWRKLQMMCLLPWHDDVIKWKHFPRYCPFVRGIHRSPVNSPHKGQWRGALMSSLICVWINGWVNNREASDLRRYRALCDVTVMTGLKGSVVLFRNFWWKRFNIWVQPTNVLPWCKKYIKTWQWHHGGGHVRNSLSYLPLVPHIGVSELSNQFFR